MKEDALNTPRRIMWLWLLVACALQLKVEMEDVGQHFADY